MSESRPRRTITNKYGLPASLYNALANDPYVGGGDISITRLIAPPRIVALRKRHEGEIIEDASDRIWSLLGQSAHLVAERAAHGLDGVSAEKRLSMPFEGIMTPNGSRWKWELSGQPDVFEKGGILSDYKITSVWSFMFGDKPEWDRQLNMQAMLHRHNGDEVHQLRIIAILRDWQRRKARHEKDYPQTAAHVQNFPVWSFEDQTDYALERVMLHQNAQKEFKIQGYDPEVLPMCTTEERWYRGSKYAVKKMDGRGKINKKSDRLFDKESDAIQFMADNKATLPKGKVWAPLEQRPGLNIRCMDFCDVAMFCPFGRKLKEAEAAEKEAAKATEEDES